MSDKARIDSTLSLPALASLQEQKNENYNGAEMLKAINVVEIL